MALPAHLNYERWARPPYGTLRPTSTARSTARTAGGPAGCPIQPYRVLPESPVCGKAGCPAAGRSATKMDRTSWPLRRAWHVHGGRPARPGSAPTRDPGGNARWNPADGARRLTAAGRRWPPPRPTSPETRGTALTILRPLLVTRYPGMPAVVVRGPHDTSWTACSRRESGPAATDSVRAMGIRPASADRRRRRQILQDSTRSRPSRAAE